MRVEHLTLDELKDREKYYFKYSLTNPLLGLKRRPNFIHLCDDVDYRDIRYTNGILENFKKIGVLEIDDYEL